MHTPDMNRRYTGYERLSVSGIDADSSCGNLHAVHVVAPQDGAQLFKDVDQAEGQQHLVQVVAVVEVAKQQPFQRQAKHHRQHRAAQDGQREAAEVALTATRPGRRPACRSCHAPD
jgi:ribosomal protein L32